MQYKLGLREIVFAGVLLGVPVASYMFVFSPRNAQIKQAKVEMDAKETRLADLRKLTSRIGSLDSEILSWEEALRRVNEKLPDKMGVDAILGQITEIAEGNRLLVKHVKGENAIPASLYMELPLRTTIEGSFDGFYQFLLDIEALPRITRIHQLTMSRLEPERGDDKPIPPGAMRAEFVLSIYFNPGDQQLFENVGGKRDARTTRSR